MLQHYLPRPGRSRRSEAVGTPCSSRPAPQALIPFSLVDIYGSFCSFRPSLQTRLSLGLRSHIVSKIASRWLQEFAVERVEIYGASGKCLLPWSCWELCVVHYVVVEAEARLA